MTNLEIAAFLEIIERGSFSAAANSLFITQPALSRRIIALETELGYKLFNRRKGGQSVELTPEGKRFISIAEKWKLLWNDATVISKQASIISFNMASFGSLGTYILPHILKRLLDSYPNAHITVKNYHSPEAYRYVSEGLLDFAFVTSKLFIKNVTTVEAFREPFYIIRKSRVNQGLKISPKDIDASKEIVLPWSSEYTTWHRYWFGEDHKPMVQIDEMSMMENLLNINGSWAIIPATVARFLKDREGFIIGELTDPPPDRTIYYIYGKNSDITFPTLIMTYLKDFLDDSFGKDGLFPA